MGMKPQIEPLHGGWAAVGDGWTAYGQTRSEALQTYRLARKGGSRRRATSQARRGRITRRGS
jgi:hypothetical protein